MNKTTDVIIVGAGLSGLYTALNLPKSIRVTLLSAYQDNSSLAQGGVASCIDPSDTFNNHITDTLKAGHYINDFSAVNHLVKGGPEQIKQLIDMGVNFDKDHDGGLAATLEGGHSSRRILHIQGDQTGKGIMESLNKQLSEHENISRLENAHLLSLIKENDRICGIITLINGQVHTIRSAYTVIATGGLGDLYSLTTNHSGAIGTGIALAHQAGAQCNGMHYIQFHPTAFYDPTEDQRFLLTEALRGEGAYLLDTNEHRFMKDYDQRLELAPRDIVSKAIYNELSHQSQPYVYLDTRHLDRDYLSKRFPSIHQHLKEKNLALGKDLIPVTPVAHYTIGGIAVDQKGRTTLDGLYACGEVTSSGVHGANRLASNSLLECLVYGRAIAKDLSQRSMALSRMSLTLSFLWADTFVVTPLDDDMIPYIQKTMTQKVGILRESATLQSVLTEFLGHLQSYDKSRYNKWSSFYIHSMLYTSILILREALNSPSLGCHTIDEA